MIEGLKKLKCGKVITDVDLEKYTSYKLKNKGKVLIIPENEKQLLKLLKFIKENQYKYKIIGGGSNLIFDGDYDGILIKLEKFNNLAIKDTFITVQTGYSLMKLALKVSRMGLTGMEFATGIPGTVGGAVFNNSGAYGSDMGYIIESVKVINEDLKIERIYNKDLDYHYRTSLFKKNNNYVILEANIVLKKSNPYEIISIIEDRKRRRIMSQPLDCPSAGSVFRNPTSLFAGKLIEDSGLKGKIIGGAKISEKHANFIINDGSATGEDIVKLIECIKKTVLEKFNIDLILEQEIVK